MSQLKTKLVKRPAKQEIETELTSEMLDIPKEPGPGPVTEHDILGMFQPPANCQTKHVYTVMKMAELLRESAVQLWYGCPHNEHLWSAIKELQVVFDLSCKAILSE